MMQTTIQRRLFTPAEVLGRGVKLRRIASSFTFAALKILELQKPVQVPG